MTDTRAVDAALRQRVRTRGRGRRRIRRAERYPRRNLVSTSTSSCHEIRTFGAEVQIARRMRAMMDTQGLGGSSSTRLAGRI